MANSSDIQRELLSLVRAQQGDTSAAGSLLPVIGNIQPQAPDAVIGGVPAGDGVAQLARELESLRRQLGAAEETSRRQADVLEQNTRAVLESGSRLAGGSGGVVREAASAVRGSGALNAVSSPLAGLVSWLFRRKSDSPTGSEGNQLTLPAAINESLGVSSSSGPAPVTYRADGVPRTVSPASATAPVPSNITVQVQTMDSRSFLDNSDQIARAVREAMLNSHALNDVIGEM